jgi:hypothetical protein
VALKRKIHRKRLFEAKWSVQPATNGHSATFSSHLHLGNNICNLRVAGKFPAMPDQALSVTLLASGE